MPTFKRRPSFVDAVQYVDKASPPRGVRTTAAGTAVVDTSSITTARVYLTEWVCADPDGKHFYPMSDDLFKRLFEPVEESWPLKREKPKLKLVSSEPCE